ncbi:MAG: hypothetical protein HY719_17920 [Planctomycetes bacterium]|nr:hypothetical protein [Planctomycetota bacterium]
MNTDERGPADAPPPENNHPAEAGPAPIADPHPPPAPRALAWLALLTLVLFLAAVGAGLWVYAVDTRLVAPYQRGEVARLMVAGRDGAALAHWLLTWASLGATGLVLAAFIALGAKHREAGRDAPARWARFGRRGALLLLLLIAGEWYSGVLLPWREIRAAHRRLAREPELDPETPVGSRPRPGERSTPAARAAERGRRLVAGEDPMWRMHVVLPAAAAVALLSVGLATHMLWRAARSPVPSNTGPAAP